MHGRGEARLDRMGEQDEDAHAGAQPCAARARASRPGKRKFLPAEKSKSGFSQAIILPGLSRPLRVGLALEGELDRVGLLHAAFLERVAMRVEDHRAHRLVLGDDLVEPRLGGEADERQPGEADRGR